MDIQNQTPFEFLPLPGYDKDGGEVFTLVLKGTFVLAARQALVPAPVQRPLALTDEHYGEPGASPVRCESELALFKPSCDLVLVGSAWAPDGKPTRKIPVAFGVGGTVKLREAVADEPSKRIPLRSLEEGGGKGSSSAEGKAPDGFGFYPRSRQPRLGYAGTYDDAWKAERAPFLPADFDYRYFQSAYPDLVLPAYPAGGEPLRIRNAAPDGWIEARVPAIAIEASVRFEAREDVGRMALDTIVCEPDDRRMTLLWRRMVPCHGEQQAVLSFLVRAVSGLPGS